MRDAQERGREAGVRGLKNVCNRLQRTATRCCIASVEAEPESMEKLLAQIYHAGESVLTAGEEVLLAACQRVRK